ncbi:hypothetical protein [Microbacterium ureisolvens]|uniref:Prepilin-type N-terminal cleavage/methylation domain-containing protein n=1 Tax=Microbacterium ureisolvens TaxID=2781186 RepID=A0ABS7HUH3_9MICO|nr:hypothetical protein [Microbacterium ureisolvens]MBW9108893.1 hypothetical protein [Microbacterium ureisolvens]
MMHAACKNDEGLSFVELIVSVLVSVIVIVAIATVLANSWQAQEQVTTVTQATNRGQLVSSTIERAMRNALFFEVTESGTVLRVRTSLSGDKKCQGFRITDAAAQFTWNSVTLTTSNTAWPSWQPGINAQGGTPYFVRTPEGSLSYTFKITTEAAPVAFSGDVAPRSVQETGSGGCW